MLQATADSAGATCAHTSAAVCTQLQQLGTVDTAHVYFPVLQYANASYVHHGHQCVMSVCVKQQPHRRHVALDNGFSGKALCLHADSDGTWVVQCSRGKPHAARAHHLSPSHRLSLRRQRNPTFQCPSKFCYCKCSLCCDADAAACLHINGGFHVDQESRQASMVQHGVKQASFSAPGKKGR